MTKWYVVQTKAKHETTAQRNLDNQAFQSFLPWLRVNKHVRGRWQAVREPLFPGYLFVELDLATQNTAPIHSTRGVVRLLRQGSELKAFPDTELQALMQAQEVTGDAIEPASIFKDGDSVRLVSGPMAGISAIFKAKNSQDRVVLLLNILGNETQVSVSPHQITKAS